MTNDTRIDTSPPSAAIRAPRGTLTWTPPTAGKRREILAAARSVAVLGASANPARPSNEIATYLLESTAYQVFLVNPGLTELLGQPVYPSVRDIPERPDLVTVFRNLEHIPDAAEDVIAAGAGTLWLQLGLWHEPVAQRATDAGLDVVMNRCIMVEHKRFF